MVQNQWDTVTPEPSACVFTLQVCVQRHPCVPFEADCSERCFHQHTENVLRLKVPSAEMPCSGHMPWQQLRVSAKPRAGLQDQPGTGFFTRVTLSQTSHSNSILKVQPFLTHPFLSLKKNWVHSKKKIIFNWNIVDLQCVNFCLQQSDAFIYIYTSIYILFLITSSLIFCPQD